MAVSAELWLKVKDDASRKLDALKGKVASVGTSIKSHLGDAMARVGQGMFRVLDRLGATLLRLGKYAAMVGVGLAAWAIGKGVGFASQLEQWNAQLTILYRSSLRAREAMAFLRKFAETTPFELSEIVPAALSLEAGGLNVRRWIRVAGDLSAALKRPFEEVADTLRRVAAGGDVQRSLRTLLIGREELQLKGIKFGGGDEILSSTTDVMDAVEKIVVERFGGMTELSSKTFLGRWSTFKDNFISMLAKLATGIQQSLGKGIEWLIGLTERLSKSGAVERWGKAIGDAFGRAAQWVAKLADNFEQMARTKGFSAALGQLWDDFTPQLVEVLSKAFRLAFTVAWEGVKGIWASSPIGKVLLAMYAGRGIANLAGAAGLSKGASSVAMAPALGLGVWEAGWAGGDYIGSSIQETMWAPGRAGQRHEDVGTMGEHWFERGESLFGKGGGEGALRAFLANAKRYKDLREASLKTEEQLSGQLEKQTAHAKDLVLSARAHLDAVEAARAAALAQIDASSDYADEQIRALQAKMAAPAERQLQIQERMLELTQRMSGLSYKTGDPDSLKTALANRMEAAKEYVRLRLEAYEIQVKENNKAKEFNASLAERLAMMKPGDQRRALSAIERLKNVQSADDLARLMQSQRFLETIGGIETIKRFQPRFSAEVLARYPQAPASAVPDLAPLSAEWKGLMQEFAKSVKEAATIMREEEVHKLKALLKDTAVGVIVSGKLAAVLEVKSDKAEIERAVDQIIADLPKAVLQELRRNALSKALEAGGAAASQDLSMEPLRFSQ